MKNYLLILILIILNLCGCSPDNSNILKKEGIGKIINVQPGNSLYNGYMWITITTEKSAVTIPVPREPISIGKEAYLIEKQSGNIYVEWEGGKYMYDINPM